MESTVPIFCKESNLGGRRIDERRIYITTFFQEYYHNFCSRLKDRGVNVLGVGDCPYDMIGDDTKNSLTEYYYVEFFREL